MKMRVFLFLALAVCAHAADLSQPDHTAEKRQTQEGSHLLYRQANKQGQVAPVQEPQEYDKGHGNRTTLQPTSEDESSNVDRQTREQPTTVQPASETQQQNDNPEQNQINSETLNEQPSLMSAPISVEDNSLTEDRHHHNIPPPRDGKSYTPEEFTSLIVSGFAVTPIPDYGGVAAINGLVSPVGPVSQGPVPLAPEIHHHSLPQSIPVPNPASAQHASILNPALHQPIPTSALPHPGIPVPNPAYALEQARLIHQYKQSLETLPLPKNSKFYTPEEFHGLIAAGYPVTAVPVNALNYGVPQPSRSEEEYRPGQVYSLNPQELLDLQPERKAPLASNQLLQQLYANPQQEHKQNLQQIYYLEPQTKSDYGRQVSPSHAVITRPHYSFNGGEASVGAALSVSDNGASQDPFDRELLALLGQAQVRQESNQHSYSQQPTQAPQPSTTVRSVAPQYQQIGYVSKPTKKSSKLRSKVHVSFPQTTEAPQQYLIETTNVQQRQQPQPQYRPHPSPVPTPQPQRLAQALRYVPISQSQQQEYAYESPEPQGLKIVPAPQLQQLRPQPNYRVPQYQQEAQPKQYRLVEVPQQPRAQPIRHELRIPASNVERPVAYLKRYNEPEKQRSVKIYDPVQEDVQQSQLFGEQFVLRPVYRNEQQRPRYEAKERVAEATKAPHSTIYVSKNLPAPRKLRPVAREQTEEPINVEQHGHSLDEQRSLLPPPKNNKAYTPEEFAALVAAGFSVTPVPVSVASLEGAQSRITEEAVTPDPVKRRLAQRRRNQYLPVRDDAP